MVGMVGSTSIGRDGREYHPYQYWKSKLVYINGKQSLHLLVLMMLSSQVMKYLQTTNFGENQELHNSTLSYCILFSISRVL